MVPPPRSGALVMSLSPEFIDDVRARTDLVGLIGHRVKLTRRGGEYLGLCPFHNEKTPSFAVNEEKGFYHCFGCGAQGGPFDFVMNTEGLSFLAAVEKLAEQAGVAMPRRDAQNAQKRPSANLPKSPQKAPTHPRTRLQPPSVPDEWPETLASYQTALPGSPGEDYLTQRRIPLDVAQRYGVGYAAPGAWAHRLSDGRDARGWPQGRLVVPHTDPAGKLVNLYGRAVGDDVPKALRHDHLPGQKGYFNAAALRAGGGSLYVAEGAFDALALISAGYARAVGIFGLHGWRWDWARDVNELVFAFDADAVGAGWRTIGRQALLRGKRVSYLLPEAYGGCNDAAEAWAAGTLNCEITTGDIERSAIMEIDGGGS